MVSCSHLDLGRKGFNLMTSLSGLILLLPVYKVQKLQMPLKQKLGVIGIFGLGALVTVTGIIRLHFVVLANAPVALSGNISCMFVPKSYNF